MIKVARENLPRLFVDTWGWLSLEDSREPAYEGVTQVRRRYALQHNAWVTTDFVLDETITRLFARRPFDEAAKFCDGLFEAKQQGSLWNRQ